MTNKQIGKVHEKRGDDFYIVSATQDGDIVEVQQYDAIGHRHYAINFFAETAPRLVALIQKAAGIKDKEPEYEYALQMERILGTGEPYTLSRHWGGQGEYWGSLEDRQTELNWHLAEFPNSKFWLVRRLKAGSVEQVED